MKTKRTRKTKRTKRLTSADAVADVYWRGKLREFEDCLRRARSSPANIEIVDEIAGWLELMEEMGI